MKKLSSTTGKKSKRKSGQMSKEQTANVDASGKTKSQTSDFPSQMRRSRDGFPGSFKFTDRRRHPDVTKMFESHMGLAWHRRGL